LAKPIGKSRHPYWLIYPPKGVPKIFSPGTVNLITQPRIVATTDCQVFGLAFGIPVGKGFDIGYRYSKDRNNDRFNAAFLATDGSLINMIMNGQLSDLSVIMIDEAHERSENIDIILRLLKDQLPLYPHLKLLIVSATINKESFLKYFGEDTAKVIAFEAKRKFEYKRFFATEKEKLPYEDLHKLRDCLVPALVAKVLWLLEEQVAGRKTLEVVIDKRKVKANTLAFLQGVKPIEEAVNALTKAIAASPTLKNKVEVYPLYSDLEEKKKGLKGRAPVKFA
jgi:HrpA-like RNA helicase